ncbi:MAG: fibronectin type III domain-containing protein [Clostridium sp.]|nr:fibronectin type III domain-containing protein [Clostridium sp.]MCM1547377.1 fibronectin type III domain-containing protein [Ruminococcus sp.]
MKNAMRKRSLKRKIASLLAVSMVCTFTQTVSAEIAASDIVGTQQNSETALLEDGKNDVLPIDPTGITENDTAPPNITENDTVSADTSESDTALADITESDTVPTDTAETDTAPTDTTENNADVTDNAPPAAGKIDVSIGMALFFDNAVDFTVSLTNNDGYSRSDVISVGNSDEEKIAFDNVEDGEYTLTVSADGFAAYSQDITVAQKLYDVKLTAGFCEGYSYASDTLHPGVIMVGDVDGSNIIDDTDKSVLIDAVDGIDISEDCITDLNRDGETDLLDLMFFTKSYKEDKDTAAAVEEFISPLAIGLNVSENTAITGDPEKMLCGEDTVTLTPADESEISEDNPVSLEFDLLKGGNASVADGITFETGSDNPVSEAFIDISYTENGKEYEITVPVKSGINYLLKESEVYAELDENGNINVHLGNQIAVKRVILTITEMQNNNNLAEISKVEFVNGMESRIPEPEMDIPENLTANEGSENFTLKWDACKNVTGYEVKIQQGNIVETVIATTNSIKVSTFNGKEIKNYTTYNVSVQSINGTWKSGYCDSVEVTPKPSGPPDKPDNVSAVGRYKSITVSWKNMDDTLSYNLFYKLRNSDEEYTEISDIKENKYTISGLEDLKEYEIYVIGINELGKSPQSIHCAAVTTDLNPAEIPKYNLINRDESGIPGSTHIISATRNGGSMIESDADADLENTAWGTIDNNAASYYSKATWDDGGFNNLGSKGLTYTFDKTYKMDTIALLATEDMQYSYVHLRWWEDNGDAATISPSVQARKDSEGRVYYVIKLPYAVTANKVQIGLARYLAGGAYNLITVSEAYFFHYDELRDEIMALYSDDLHTVLKDDVTQETIDILREKVNAPDEFGEENPNKTALLRELETAEKILNDESLKGSLEVHNGISTNDTARGFSGLNAWQPLGISAAAGETITVYVGHNTKSTGDSANLQLVASQYHSEAGGVGKSIANLKVGANEVTIPAITSSVGAEAGGALYIQYTGNNANDRYAVRVSGGAEVPFLDLYKVTDESERMEKTVKYVEELEQYVSDMEKLHNKLHGSSDNKNVKYDYDNKNCILGASDIMLDTMMLSLPAQQILAGAGSGNAQKKAETILESAKAMEDMMYLFYQHKGLNESAANALNQIPKGHLNIRYQRMFSGAFMYASGNHIGIEWNETKGMVNCEPVTADENGKYVSGRYFGWGIAHEIGHCINQGSYAVAEITNNYFAQLAQAKDTNTGMRFNYKNIFSKVTSGAKGNSSNIATQLGMYWQLHLAYDKGLNYKTYSDYNEQLENLFYARVDTYSRDPKSAPAPNGTALTLGNSTDQNLMRLACAAAERNVLEFFERWGKTPDKTTIAYAEQFEKESRAIFYANDDSRIYALEGSGSVLDADGSSDAIKNVSVNIGAEANQVELEFSSADIPEDDILGYEVIRCTISGGKNEETPVGFAEGSEFTDTVTTLNNRTVFYKITLIDKYLNRSATFTTKMVKIQHEGNIDKTNWTVNTSGLTADYIINDATDEMPCEQTKIDPAEQAIDNDAKTVYTPTVDGNTAEIIIDFNSTLTATGFKYTAGNENPVGKYEIYVMSDNEWILTSEGTLNGSKTVYFANDDDKYISTYSASALKFVLLDQKDSTVSIAELDVLGVTGDNVDFRRTDKDTKPVIGILSADYKYGENPEDVIPENSIIFTGSYKGNPAYNVVLLYDEQGNIVGGVDAENNITAGQIILADVPDNSNIANVSDGTWIYWIEPQDMNNMKMPETVRAELYRVNNALTNEGQRLVSDSLFESVPDELPDITLN